MIFQVRGVADAFNAPDIDPRNPLDPLTTFNAGTRDRLEQAGKSDDGDWIDVRNSDFDFPHMWVRAADIADADLSKPLPVDLFTFVTLATIVAEDFNSRQPAGSVGVSRDYLLALSVVLNGLERLGFTDDALKSFDAFHFTESEWSRFCNDPALNVNGRQSFDRFDPLAQIDAAVNLAFAATKEAQKAPTSSDPAAGAYVPNSIDLFLMRMLGPAAGLAILKDRLAGVALTKPWSDYVGAAGGDLASLKAQYPQFLNVAGADSAADLSGRVETIFDMAYVVVSKIVSDSLPQDAPPTQGPPEVNPPWMEVAAHELQKGVERPNARILDYLEITDTGSPTVKTPWCGGFVAFCLDSARIKIPTHGAAAAATWSRWGRPVSAPQGPIPLGAVVVISSTPESDAAGHVAFCAGEDPKSPSRILLLGGNQGAAHSVKISSFPRSCVLAIRWPTDPSVSPPDLSITIPSGGGGAQSGGGTAQGGGAQAGAAVGGRQLGLISAGTPAGGGTQIAVVGDVGIGTFTPDDWNRYCDVLGKRESTNNYAAVNRIGYCGRWQFGALALADFGYVRKGTPQGQLANPLFWTGKDGIQNRKDWCLSPQVQNNAMLAYTRAHYSQLKRLGVLAANSPKSDLAGYLAAAHLVGVGGAEDLHNHVSRHDANGVTSKQYFDLLSKVF